MRVGKQQARIAHEASRAGDRARGTGGQRTRVPSPRAGMPSSGDAPKHVNPVPAAIPQAGPIEGEVLSSSSEPTLADYKGMSLTLVGRDLKGRVIPHKRSEKVARQIRVWIAGGYDLNAIAINLNIRPGLLKQVYAVELAIGGEQVGMDMTSHIVKRAKKSDRMAIFFAKAKMGWKEDQSAQNSGSLLNIHIHV